MSLRDDLIEAGAEAYASVIIASRDDEEVTAYELRQKAMTAAFDAFLDTLADTDDIPLYPSETGYRDVVYTNADGVTAAYLVAVLRGDT